jgi:tetratricopeptide (TPR) repeat protein
MKKITLFLIAVLTAQLGFGQALNFLNGSFNLKSSMSQRIGLTTVEVIWTAPGVKGREGAIWGTPVAHYGFQNLGFGTSTAAPWRAGANECTTISFSTDVEIEGKKLAAGTYGFFVALGEEQSTVIFSTDSEAWGSYFYDERKDALRVTVRQQKDQKPSIEWLNYSFENQTRDASTLVLAWEYWRIPINIKVDLKETVIANLREELSGDKGFYDENWLTAANFCLQQNTNLEEALIWANNAVSPPFGKPNFNGLTVKAGILDALGRKEEADQAREQSLEAATVFEMHGYGRQLIAQKKPKEAIKVFEKNFEIYGDTWPTHVGLTRGYSADGQLDKALEHAKIALGQAKDDLNKANLQGIIETLESGKPIEQ